MVKFIEIGTVNTKYINIDNISYIDSTPGGTHAWIHTTDGEEFDSYMYIDKLLKKLKDITNETI